MIADRSRVDAEDARASPDARHEAERGSITVLSAAVMAALVVLAMGASDVARVLHAASRAQTAADAAALAAAQALAIDEPGPEPTELAGEYAARNGAALETCACDRGTFEATVTVRLPVGDLFLVAGDRTVRAEARAQVDLPVPDLPSDRTALVGSRVYDASTMAAMRQRLPVKRGRRHLLATVDYSLAKRALINQVRTGLASWTDICDAHPELMRAAEHVGEQTRRECPVCHDARLKLVTYVYGDGLKHDNGRVWPLDVGLDMAADRPGSWCYVVEVCTECHWNHLHEAFVARAG